MCVQIKNVSCIHDMTGALSQLHHVPCDLAVTQLRIFNVAKAGTGMPPFFSCLPFNEAVGGSIRSSLTQQDQKKRKKTHTPSSQNTDNLTLLKHPLHFIINQSHRETEKGKTKNMKEIGNTSSVLWTFLRDTVSHTN